MHRTSRILIVLLLLVSLLAVAGCNYDYKQLLQKNESPEPELLKAEIYFAGRDPISAYVKSLGVEEDGEVYIGGSALTYIYNKKGQVIGSLNYARVQYIKIVE